MIRLVIILALFSVIQKSIAQEKLGRQFFELAEQKVKDKEWNSAKDYINQCLIATPTHAAGYAMRGEINENLGKPKEALTDYSIAIELLPELTDCYLKRGVLAFSLDRFDLARADFRKLLTIQDQETNMIYFQQSNNEQFHRIFTIQSGIKDMVYNYLGLIETRSDSYTTAILYFDSAIRVNPNDPDYYAHRGLAYLNQEEIESASNEFKKALKIDPDHSISKSNLATIRRKQGRLAEAEQYLKEAKSISQRTPDYFSNLGLLQLESGRYKEAILNFDSAISISPTEGELYINRGLAKEKAGEFKSALQDYSHAIRIDSEWPKAWFVQGNYFMKQNEWEKALENYNVALTFDEDYSLAYYNRAIVNYQLKQYDKACADLRKAETKGMVPEVKMKEIFCQN
jgi:tetratricopeptide (TPR) repeat protein